MVWFYGYRFMGSFTAQHALLYLLIKQDTGSPGGVVVLLAYNTGRHGINFISVDGFSQYPARLLNPPNLNGSLALAATEFKGGLGMVVATLP